MVRITPEHHEATQARACGLTYAQIADQMNITPDRAKNLIQEWSRVVLLQLNAEQDLPDDPPDGS